MMIHTSTNIYLLLGPKRNECIGGQAPFLVILVDNADTAVGQVSDKKLELTIKYGGLRGFISMDLHGSTISTIAAALKEAYRWQIAFDLLTFTRSDRISPLATSTFNSAIPSVKGGRWLEGLGSA